MDDGTLLHCVEGLGNSPFVASGGEIWERLQGEKEEVSRELLADGPLIHADDNGRDTDSAYEVAREIEWRHREHLEERLRNINDAQDRLMGGQYGRCGDCGQQIDSRRLIAEPAAQLCLACQRVAEREGLSVTL